ncbi:MAG: sugar isomerase domain-containing protein [Streptosporangiales bacterium]
MPTNGLFVPRLQRLLDALGDQDESFDAAATLLADTLAADNLVHLFGSGHSVIPVMDAFPRYGSYVGLHPLIDPRLAWWEVTGPGGAPELLWLERTEGYVENFLAHRPIRAADCMVVFSHGGRNAAPVEAAMYARDRGVRVLAVTSRANLDRPSSHSSGSRLADLADVVIDTGVPPEDALVSLDGWDVPVAGASTVVACACMAELNARTAALLAERGIRLPTFVSPTAAGVAPDHNQGVFDAHQDRIAHAAIRPAEVTL